MFVDPVVAHATLDLQVEPEVRARLPQMAKGRPLVIDFWLARLRGVSEGGLRIRFCQPREPRFVQLDPIEGVEVLIERHLIPVVEAATVRLSGLPFARHLDLVLARPEAWIEFLDSRQSR